MRARRDRQILLAIAACSVGVPAGASAWLTARTSALADQIAAAGGVAARIGRVDADLTGAIRFSDVAVGELIAADAVEASVALASLVRGELRADEIRVAGPRVAIQVDAGGDSDVARLARRLVRRARASGSGSGDAAGRPAGRLRRIIVSAGALSARIAGVGELAADGVEIVPDAGGIRVITGAVRLRGSAGPLGVALGFTHSAAELTLPHLQLGRVLAVGGAGAIAAAPGPAPGDPGARLREVAVGRLAPDAPFELRAQVDDGGIPRPLAVDVQPRGFSIAVRGEHLPLRVFAGAAPHGLDLATAHASGAVALHRDARRLAVDVDGTVEGISVDYRVLAAAPVPLAGAVHATLAVSAEAVALPHAEIELGAARWTVNGWLRRGTPVSGQLDLALAEAPCGDLLASLPVPLRGPLDGMVLDGSFGGRIRLGLDLAAPAGEGVSLTTSIRDACHVVSEPPAADVGRLAVASEQQFPDGGHARVGKGEPGWIALSGMPPYVPGAFVSAEDARFYRHAGFDLDEIARSLEIDLREHRLARGGSTISQQLVKNAFLPARRSFDRKLQEAILTWRVEARLDKRQILERYLNIIELGPRVYGIAAAARHWFGATPRELSIRQAAFLAALTAEPSSMGRRVRQAGGLDADSAARVDVVLRAMRRDGTIDGDELDAARTSPLRWSPGALKAER